MFVSIVVAASVLAATWASISASQSTLVVVLVPDVVVESAADAAMDVELDTVAMSFYTGWQGGEPAQWPAHQVSRLAQQLQKILRHLVGGGFGGDRRLHLHLRG